MTAFPFSIRFSRHVRRTNLADEDAVARRDFVCRMIDENPNAFASDLDVCEIMRHFPGRF